jgi:ferric-dicitrate binding protein FerR (iron transport regulator)
MTISLSDDTLDRYFAGTLDHETAERVREYLQATPERRGIAAGVRAAIGAADVPGTITSLEAARDALFARLDTAERTEHRRPSRSSRTIGTGSGMILGAIGLGAIGLGAIGLGVGNWREWSVTTAPDAGRRYQTASGQMATLTLSDGSRITLAPNSSFRVAKSFGRTERQVSLSGEAHFDVTADTRRPFTVMTGKVATLVLGTTFGVRHYPGDVRVRVVVTNGRVASGGLHGRVTLSPGDVGEITDSTAVSTTTADASVYTQWMRGELVFEDTPVATVLQSVGRWYGYDFVLKDSMLARKTVTTVLSVSAPQETMRALRDLLDVTMTVDGRTITLDSRRTRAATRAPSKQRVPQPVFTQPEVGR